MRIILLALPLAVALSCAASAGPPEATARIVRYGDLDTGRPADLRTLRRRIARALEAVCGSYEGTSRVEDEEEADRIARCRAQASAHIETTLASHGIQLASSR